MHQALIKILAILYGVGLIGQHLLGAVPYWEIAWDSGLLSSIVLQNWSTWLETGAPVLQQLLWWIGVSLSVGFTLFFILVKKHSQDSYARPIQSVGKVIAYSLGVFLAIMSLWEWRDHAYAWPFLVEHSLRIVLPWLLYVWGYDDFGKNKRSRTVALIALTLTFLGHGWYALDLAPMPGDFLYMTTRSFQISEPLARSFLHIMGVLDIAFVVLLWVKPIQRIALWYAAIWGLMTACARLTGHFYPDFPLDSLITWLPEVLVRLGHGLVPVLLLFFVDKKADAGLKKNTNQLGITSEQGL